MHPPIHPALRLPESGPGVPAPTGAQGRKFRIFISYSHGDNRIEGRQWANWLQDRLEKFKIPRKLVARAGTHGPVPANLRPVFRDETDLSAQHDLAAHIHLALEQSESMVVICSPNSARSEYVGKEIRYFRELGRGARIHSLIISGEPDASAVGKGGRGVKPEEECFHPALREVDGGAQQEPIAADARMPNGQESATRPKLLHLSKAETTVCARKLESAFLKLVAGIVGVPVSDFTQFHTAAVRRSRNVRAAVASVLILLSAVSLLLWKATRSSSASREVIREIAEHLDLTEWTDRNTSQLTSLEQRLADIDPSQSPAVRSRINSRLNQLVRVRLARVRLDAGDQLEVEALLAWCGRRDAGLASQLRQDLQKRLELWREDVHLAAPYAAFGQVFSPNDCEVKDGVVRKAAGSPGLSLTLVPSGQFAEAEAEFVLHWPRDPFSEFGLSLNVLSDGSAGYHFTVREVSNESKRGYFAELRRRGGTLASTALRSEDFAEGSRVRLRARREGARLAFAVNNSIVIETEDVFPEALAADNRFALRLGDSHFLTSFIARTRRVPAQPSALEAADQLYLSGDLPAALKEYETACTIHPFPDVSASEAHYKRGVMLATLNRGEEAETAWSQVIVVAIDRWAALGMFRLWLRDLQAGQKEKADTMLDLFLDTAREVKLQLSVSRQESEFITVAYGSTGGVEHFKSTPGQIERARRFMHLQGFLENGDAWGRFNQLAQHTLSYARAMHFAGRGIEAVPAIDTALSMARSLGISERSQLLALLSLRAWITRFGLAGEVQTLFEPWWSDESRFPEMDVERARARCRREEWKEALVVLDRLNGRRPAKMEAANRDVFVAGLIIKGFIHRRMGDNTAVEKLWQEAMVMLTGGAKAEFSFAGGNGTESQLLLFSLLTLTHTWNEECAKSCIQNILFSVQGRDTKTEILSRAVPQEIISSVLSRFLDQPRGDAWIESYMFRTGTGPDAVTVPVELFMEEFLRQQLMPEAPQESNPLLSALTRELLAAYRNGEVSDAQVLQLALAWKSGGGLAWTILRGQLTPETRARFAFLLGLKARRQGNSADARSLWSEVSQNPDCPKYLQTAVREFLKSLAADVAPEAIPGPPPAPQTPSLPR